MSEVYLLFLIIWKQLVPPSVLGAGTNFLTEIKTILKFN